MPSDTFDTDRYRYLCIAPFGQQDPCILRYRPGQRSKRWVRDVTWKTLRYRRYRAAREAALRIVAEDGAVSSG